MSRTANISKTQKRTAVRAAKNSESGSSENSGRTKKMLTITIDKNLVAPAQEVARRDHRSFSNLCEFLLAKAVREDKEKEEAAA